MLVLDVVLHTLRLIKNIILILHFIDDSRSTSKNKKIFSTSRFMTLGIVYNQNKYLTYPDIPCKPTNRVTPIPEDSYPTSKIGNIFPDDLHGRWETLEY